MIDCDSSSYYYNHYCSTVVIIIVNNVFLVNIWLSYVSIRLCKVGGGCVDKLLVVLQGLILPPAPPCLWSTPRSHLPVLLCQASVAPRCKWAGVQFRDGVSLTRFITRYTVPDGDVCAHDILEAADDCAKHACECNSFYLDLYMDDRCLAEAACRGSPSMSCAPEFATTRRMLLAGCFSDLSHAASRNFVCPKRVFRKTQRGFCKEGFYKKPSLPLRKGHPLLESYSVTISTLGISFSIFCLSKPQEDIKNVIFIEVLRGV